MALPIRLRLTLWYVVLLALILVAGGAFLVASLRSELTQNLDQTLRSSTTEIAADLTLGNGRSESEFQDVTDTSLAGLPRDASGAQLVTPEGQILLNAGNSVIANARFPADLITVAAGGGTGGRTIVLQGTDYRVYTEPFVLDGRSHALVVATSLEGVESATHRLTLLLGIMIPIGIAFASLGGWWLAGKSLRPVARMTTEAGEIDASRLGDRIDVPSPMDEFGRLAVTLNAMLDRIQGSVDQQREFVSNASHELRTPLAIMRAEIDVSLAAPALSQEAHDTLLSAREETDRMREIVEDLLLLARMDEHALDLASEPIDLCSLATDAMETIAPLAADKQIGLSMPEAVPTIVFGDRARMQQVIRNLLENAVKYSPVGGEVTVGVRGGREHGDVIVTNAGSTIPAEAVPRIFDRFYRNDQSRNREAGGSGLGLAIVRELVEAQGGRVWASSTDVNGTEIGCSLPTQVVQVPADPR